MNDQNLHSEEAGETPDRPQAGTESIRDFLERKKLENRILREMIDSLTRQNPEPGESPQNKS